MLSLRCNEECIDFGKKLIFNSVSGFQGISENQYVCFHKSNFVD